MSHLRRMLQRRFPVPFGRGWLGRSTGVGGALAGWVLAMTVSAAEPMPVTLEPLCRVPLLAARALAPGNPAPSTRRMAERLLQLRKSAEPGSMAYLSDELIPLIQRRLAETTDVGQRIDLGLQLGIQQTQAGQPDAAINTLAGIDDVVAAGGGSLSSRGQAELRMRRAIAWLRLGEQENCLATHGPDSCLFPLAPAAFHRLTRGSRNALGLLNAQLQARPGDLGSRWLLNLAHMTLGEYPDRVPPQWLIPPSVFASEYPLPRFPDVAGVVGLDTYDLAGGVVIDDFDRDGFLDVVVSSWSLDGQLRIYRNDGTGRFTERTSEAGLVGLTSGLNLMQTDYNNDGHLDLWIVRGGWLGKAGRLPNSLLRNNGDGTFTDVTEESGMLSFHPTQTSAWFDYDGDGWLDVFVGNESTDPKDPDYCELFHNNRNGTFTEVAQVSGLAVAKFIKGVTASDYDNDGRPDLYLSCRNGPNLLFHNDGPDPQASPAGVKWKFTDVSVAAGVTEPIESFPTWFFDFDNDGWDDLFCSGYGIRNVGDIAADYLGLPGNAALPKLYRNDRKGGFTDVTVTARMNRVCHTMGCNYGDLDNDGWLDFYCSTGDPDFTTLIPNRMFRNAGGERFQDVTTATGTGHLQKGHAVSFADLDNDGDQDVYAVIGGAYSGDIAHNVLFQNPGTTNRWLNLKLVGERANRAAIGARVQVRFETPVGPRSIHRTVTSGASFGGNPLRLELGLANATRIQSVEIRWPGSDTRQTVTGLELDRAYEVVEGKAVANPVAFKAVTWTKPLGKTTAQVSAPAESK
jgi:hypothetical protein